MCLSAKLKIVVQVHFYRVFFVKMYDNFFTFCILFIFVMSIILGIYSIIPTLLCFCGVTLIVCLLLHALDFFYFSYLFLIIYVGAIAILFTYVIMLLNLHNIDVYTRSRINFHIIFLTVLFLLFLYFFIYFISTSSSFGHVFVLLVNLKFNFDDVFLIYMLGDFFKHFNFVILTDLQQIGYFLFYAFQIHIIICTLLLLTALFGVLVLSSNSRNNIVGKFWLASKNISFFKF